MAAHPRLTRIVDEPLAVIGVAAAVFSALSIYQLRNFPFPHDLHSAISAIFNLAPDTAVAALSVWGYWAWSAALIAVWVHKLDREVNLLDAGLIGIAGVWVLAYFAGTMLGPVGLFRAPMLWLFLLVATFLLRRDIRLPQFKRPSFGAGITLIAIVLAAVSLLPLQLGAPVAPYMDVLSWPASAQRVITFGRYLAFNNDPYGVWGPNVQQPALELFYSYLALGSRTRLAVLAESSLIFPIAAVTILGTYRLGIALFDETTGGAAALLLLLTTLFRWTEGMRGTAVAFALFPLGLALFVDPRGSRTRMTAGALMLGVTLPSHAIDGALALGVASVGCGCWGLAGDGSRFKAGVLCLTGAMLVGAPEIFIALATAVPALSLMMMELVGAALIVFGSALLRKRAESEDSKGLLFVSRLLLLLVMAACFHDAVARSGSLYSEVPFNYLVLGMLASAGMVATVVLPPREDTVGRLFAMIAMLLPPLVIIQVLNSLLSGGSLSSEFTRSELSRKIADYWMPFALIFPAARLVALGCDLLPKAIVVSGLLAILIFPPARSAGIDYYTHEHSISENWMVDYSILSNGYWTETAEPRWTIGSTESRVIQILREEVQAGRITPATHVLHLVYDVSPYSKWVRFSVFTGINDDPVVVVPTEDQWPTFMAGSRAKPIAHLKEEMAKHPAYVMTELPTQAVPELGARDYLLLFDSGGIKLYRRK